MDFQTAVRRCFERYATFSGRARRSELWWFALALFVGNLIAGGIDGILFGEANVLGGLFGLATFLPALAVSVRRLHDTDRTGWWILLGLIPVVGFLVLLFFYVQDGTPGRNRFGEDPKSRGYAPA